MSSSGKKILLLTFRSSDRRRGLDLRGFSRAAGLPPEAFAVFDALTAPPDPSVLDATAAVFVGGSHLSVFDFVPHLNGALAVLVAARSRRLPTLGVCFGHQLLAHAFGGEVVRDEAGEEYGTVAVKLAPAASSDPLFRGAPPEFFAQCAHHDRVRRLPEGAVALASSAKCPVQAFTFPGESVYGVQFHPERSRADFEELCASAGPDFAAHSGGIAAARASLRETAESADLVRRFVDAFCRARP